jgi:folate-binding protein YgfZ
MTEDQTRYAVLDTMGCIEVGGNDAEHFLHGQLGLDIRATGKDVAPLAAWHDARGRVRALVRVVRLPSAFLLLLPRPHAAQVVAKLRMFVLRADVTLSHTEGRFLAALLGTPPASLTARFGPSGDVANGVAHGDGVICVSLGVRLRHLVAASATSLDAVLGPLKSTSAAAAELAEIELGLPSVGPEIAERYLPQMLNLDLLGAMSFDKGCYPGQEIIARTQNLGTVKRRLARFRVPGDEAVAVGEDILGRDGTNVGGVVRSAADAGRNEILGVVRVDALDGALHALDDRPLQRLDLPYLLP